eukprot:SAG31_NODE_1605_length_7765_cov_2.124315_7_plen_113_part_00
MAGMPHSIRFHAGAAAESEDFDADAEKINGAVHNPVGHFSLAACMLLLSAFVNTRCAAPSCKNRDSSSPMVSDSSGARFGLPVAVDLAPVLLVALMNLTWGDLADVFGKASP